MSAKPAVHGLYQLTVFIKYHTHIHMIRDISNNIFVHAVDGIMKNFDWKVTDLKEKKKHFITIRANLCRE